VGYNLPASLGAALANKLRSRKQRSALITIPPLGVHAALRRNTDSPQRLTAQQASIQILSANFGEMQMKLFSATLIGSLSAAAMAVVFAYPARTQTASPTPGTVESHLAAGKNAAGGRDDTPDFYGLVTAICVAPLNGAARPDAPAPRENPNRKETYMEPMQAFDDLYWMGTPSTSSWLLTSDDGYILYDTQRVYDAEDVLVDGIKKLGFDPAKVKYVIVSHGHAGEVGGAYLFQSRYGSRIVMNDWDMVEASVNGYPTGKPKRDIIPTDGMKITVGGRSVTL
jgi:metallo-beta-lactamase class B